MCADIQGRSVSEAVGDYTRNAAVSYRETSEAAHVCVCVRTKSNQMGFFEIISIIFTCAKLDHQLGPWVLHTGVTGLVTTIKCQCCLEEMQSPRTLVLVRSPHYC